MLPAAPGRVSTTNCWPSFSDRNCAIRRAVMSDELPAAWPTMNLHRPVGIGALRAGDIRRGREHGGGARELAESGGVTDVMAVLPMRLSSCQLLTPVRVAALFRRDRHALAQRRHDVALEQLERAQRFRQRQVADRRSGRPDSWRRTPRSAPRSELDAPWPACRRWRGRRRSGRRSRADSSRCSAAMSCLCHSVMKLDHQRR